MKLINDKGYALIIVLALITIVAVLMVPYLNSFLHDSQEIKLETVKNQNNYNLESAVEIMRAVIEANNVMLESDLGEIVAAIEDSSRELFDEELSGAIDLDNNQIIFATKNTYPNQRAESKITLTYKTYDLSLFYDNPIVINDKNQPGKKVNGNNNFKSSYDEQDILTVTDDLFQLLINFKLELFQDTFSPSGRDAFFTRWDSAPLEEDLRLANLWINGSASIEGKANKNVDLIIQEDFYVAGDLSLKKLDNLIVYGDLVVYDGSLDISSVENIEIKGSLIVNGDVRITGNPNITLGNLSAHDIHVNSDNRDIFYLFNHEDDEEKNNNKDKDKDKDKGKDKDDDDNDDGENKDEQEINREFIDGELEIESWRIE